MNWIQQEKEKMSRLDGRQKLQYTWDYYKLWVIGTAALLVFTWYMTVNMIHGNRETYLYVEYVNTFAELGEGSDFWDGFVRQTGADTARMNVSFDAQNYFEMSQKNVTGNHYYEKTVVLADSETLDAIVMEPEQLKLFGRTGRLIDLNNEKTHALAEKYSDRLIEIEYMDENGTERTIPVGFDLSGSLLEQNGAYEHCALGIAALAQNIDAVEEFLDYVTQEGESI